MTAMLADVRKRVWEVWDLGRPLFALDCCSGSFIAYSSQQASRAAHWQPATGVVEIWDPAVPEILLTVQADPADGLWNVMLSPDGQRMATAHRDNTFQLWDVDTGKSLFTLPVQNYSGRSWFTADSRLLIHRTVGGMLTAWDVASGVLLQTLQTRSGFDATVDVSPGGNWLAIGHGYGVLDIWDLQTGLRLSTLPAGGDVQFTPDGNRILAVANDGNGTVHTFKVQLFTLNLQELIALARTRVTRALTPAECQQYLHLPECP
jgi:WD40 repeat protein